MNKVTSKVKKVQPSGTYNHPKHGMFYTFHYEFEDGKELSANHKTEKSFNPGDTVEYLIKGSNEYGNYGTVSKLQEQQRSTNTNQYKADPKKQTIIVAQSSMTKAIDILLSGVVSAQFDSVSDFVKQAEDLTDLLMTKQIQLTEKHYKSF